MSHNGHSRHWRGPATVMGTGLITLDVILNDQCSHTSLRWAGGTCGNVLTILSYLGWQSYPVARLNTDLASEIVRKDLARWGVCLDFVALEPHAPTPVIVQQISRDALGLPTHRFSWRCPSCGAWLPHYRAVPLVASRGVLPNMPSVQVFFLDRLSPGALLLARACAERGGLIVFEPANGNEPRLFYEALTLAHVLKFSHERRERLPMADIETLEYPPLIVETLGQEGLRYRRAQEGNGHPIWHHLPAPAIDVLQDTAGAGDWCSAGLIHLLGRYGAAGFQRATSTLVHQALTFGQALAAWNCRFDGARGAMYAMDRNEFWLAVSLILEGQMPSAPDPRVDKRARRDSFTGLCPACPV